MIRALLGRLIDDAGQFPPARLPPAEAIAAHREARAGQWSWMIGRFLCPASRIDEAPESLPRPLGVVADGDFKQDLEAALTAGAESFELRDPGPEAYPLLGAAPIEVFVEGGAPAALHAAGVGAKLRCGGLDPAAFPADDVVAGFLGECRALDLPFKLTAGLHQPFRTEHPELGVLQHGFVNLLAATILEVDADARLAIVAEPDPAAFTVSPDGIGWRSEWARIDSVQRRRANFRSFGSCSFVEPVEGLLSHGILDLAPV